MEAERWLEMRLDIKNSQKTLPLRYINWIPSGRKYGGWRMIGDDRDERLGIKKSQNALPLRSINCIPVGVAGNMKAGGGLEMMAI
jgi:hypothetical protein